jgi:formiminoglutamase
VSASARAFEDRQWPRASAWLAGDHVERPLGTLAVVGLPVRAGSITPGRCDLAPPAIRTILARMSCGDVDAGVDLREVAVRDAGDAELAELPLESILEPGESAVRGAARGADAVAVLGGNDAITRAAARGCLPSGGRLADDLGVLTLDGHFDLRDTSEGLSNGNPIRALLEDGLRGANMAQVGIAPFANSSEYAAVARSAGIQSVTVERAREGGIAATVAAALEALAGRVRSIYVDVDLDVLDRAYAPAAPGSRPGGFTPAELRAAVRICGRHPAVRGLGIVELDPTHDVADSTTFAAGLTLLSFASGLVERLRGGRRAGPA